MLTASASSGASVRTRCWFFNQEKSALGKMVPMCLCNLAYFVFDSLNRSFSSFVSTVNILSINISLDRVLHVSPASEYVSHDSLSSW